MVRMRTRLLMAAGLVATTTLGLAACGTPSTDADDGDIVLRLSTYADFGYDDLVQEYMDAHPGVTIEHTKASPRDQVSPMSPQSKSTGFPS